MVSTPAMFAEHLKGVHNFATEVSKANEGKIALRLRSPQGRGEDRRDEIPLMPILEINAKEYLRFCRRDRERRSVSRPRVHR